MNDTQHWRAVCERDESSNGKFWYGVVTTGVYCKPSCAARRPKRENVLFFATIEAARKAGLRPCKRCKPDDAKSAGLTLTTLLDICRAIDNHPQSGNVTALAKQAGFSAFQLHRLFKSFLHVTPKEYIQQARLRSLKSKLRTAPNVTDAIYDSGLESSSAVYGRLDAHLGMTPAAYRRGGKGVDMSFAFGTTPLGKVLIGATDRGICYLQFGNSERELLEQLVKEYPNATVTAADVTTSPQFAAWMNALNANLSGDVRKLNLPLDIQGTAFQKRVWEFLRSIPSGEVASYSEVTAAIGAPNAIRAAASACANNRIGILIPCHRVIRGSGELGGYRWGLPRKRALLDMERRGRSKE